MATLQLTLLFLIPQAEQLLMSPMAVLLFPWLLCIISDITGTDLCVESGRLSKFVYSALHIPLQCMTSLALRCLIFRCYHWNPASPSSQCGVLWLFTWLFSTLERGETEAEEEERNPAPSLQVDSPLMQTHKGNCVRGCACKFFCTWSCFSFRAAGDPPVLPTETMTCPSLPPHFPFLKQVLVNWFLLWHPKNLD